MFFWPHPFRKLQHRGVVVTKRGDAGDCQDRDDFGGHFSKYDESGDIFAYAFASMFLMLLFCAIERENYEFSCTRIKL